MLYGTQALPSCPYAGDTVVVVNGDAQGAGFNTTGAKSERIAVFQAQDGTPTYISVEISFDGAPGAFSIQVQDADTDQEAFYNSISFGGATPGVISAVGTGNSARVELLIKGKFVRLFCQTQSANNQKLTAKISR